MNEHIRAELKEAGLLLDLAPEVNVGTDAGGAGLAEAGLKFMVVNSA